MACVRDLGKNGWRMEERRSAWKEQVAESEVEDGGECLAESNESDADANYRSC